MATAATDSQAPATLTRVRAADLPEADIAEAITRAEAKTSGEIVVVVAIVGILASVAMPLARVTAQRQREVELRAVLREMRTAIDKFKDAISKRFKVKDLGLIRQYLGMLITRDRTKKTLTIHMPQYVKRILEQFRLQDAHPRTLPLDPGVRYSNDMSPTSPEDVEDRKSVV